MSTPVATNDVYRTVITCHDPFHDAVNIRHFQIVGKFGVGSDQEQMVNDLFDTLAPQYAALIYNGAQFQSVSVQRILPAPQLNLVVSTRTPVIGTGGPSALPEQTAGIFTLLTGMAGRRNRGRVYVPFPSIASQQQTTPPSPNAGYQLNMGMLAAHLFGPEAINDGTKGWEAQWVLFRRKDQSFSPLVNATARSKWGTQRRRGAYGAAHK